MKPPLALSFDLDRTLLDEEGADEALRLTCDVLAAETALDSARILEANAVVWPAYFTEVEERWVRGQFETVEIGLEAWRRTLCACGCREEALAVLARDTHLDRLRAAFKLYEDVPDCFDSLPLGLPIALITNGASDLQREKIRILDIEPRFKVIVVSGEHGVAKPDAAVFRLVLDAFGITEPRDVWHIGDNLRSDVGGAKSAGLTAIWLNRDGATLGPNDPQPHIEIASLSELSKLLSP